MQSLKLTIAYDGTNYCGWQMQVRGDSVQAEIQKAFGKVLHQRVPVTASGRTDAGVHALGQVASCQVETNLSVEVLQRALNASLPTDIRIVSVETAFERFHAIVHAQSKAYRYRIWSSRTAHVFLRNYAWHVPVELDVAAMRQALELLRGTHDFASFQGSGSPRKTTIRTLYDAEIVCGSSGVVECLAETSSVVGQASRPNQVFAGELIDVVLHANGFLYNMARNIVGTLVEVGKGRREPESMLELLESRDRKKAGMTAPAQGLTLLWVRYDEMPNRSDEMNGLESHEEDE